MASAERRLGEALAAAVDRRSFDIPSFAFHTVENADAEQVRRVIVYIIANGAIEYANGGDSAFALMCRRLQDTLELYGEAINLVW